MEKKIVAQAAILCVLPAILITTVYSLDFGVAIGSSIVGGVAVGVLTENRGPVLLNAIGVGSVISLGFVVVTFVLTIYRSLTDLRSTYVLTEALAASGLSLILILPMAVVAAMGSSLITVWIYG